MCRADAKDPYSERELERSVLPEILWVRSYFRNFVKEHAQLFEPGPDMIPALKQKLVEAKALLHNPLAFFAKTDWSTARTRDTVIRRWARCSSAAAKMPARPGPRRELSPTTKAMMMSASEFAPCPIRRSW